MVDQIHLPHQTGATDAGLMVKVSFFGRWNPSVFQQFQRLKSGEIPQILAGSLLFLVSKTLSWLVHAPFLVDFLKKQHLCCFNVLSVYQFQSLSAACAPGPSAHPHLPNAEPGTDGDCGTSVSRRRN